MRGPGKFSASASRKTRGDMHNPTSLRNQSQPLLWNHITEHNTVITDSFQNHTSTTSTAAVTNCLAAYSSLLTRSIRDECNTSVSLNSSAPVFSRYKATKENKHPRKRENQEEQSPRRTTLLGRRRRSSKHVLEITSKIESRSTKVDQAHFR